VLWAFLGIGALWMFGAFTIAAATIASHHVEVNHGGDLLIIDHATGAARIWAAVQDVFFPVLGLSAVSCLVRQTLVFRHASGERRQQLKWLVAGGAVFLISAAVSLGTANSNQPVKYALNFISGIGLLALPICIGVGVLKYGLFEIDRIVSRTLSYAIVTALLVATYVGLVALTTQALPISSPVGVATGTLAAAALFNPLRRRVQRIVDHRFNRARYDAEATVAAFAARLRDAVDLETTERELLDAVRLVVAPSDVTIWLKQS
jgi:hypothetical protein